MDQVQSISPEVSLRERFGFSQKEWKGIEDLSTWWENEVSSERIATLVQWMEANQVAVHGVSRSDRAETVKREGVKALTPEGHTENHAFTSYWNAGMTAFFEPGNKLGSMGYSFNSTVLRWAHHTDKVPGRKRMTMAMTFVGDLLRKGEHECSDPNRNRGEIQIAPDVMPEELVLLSVDIESEVGKEAEVRMFELMETVMDGHIGLGQVGQIVE